MGSRPIARSKMPKGIFYFNDELVDKEISAHYNSFVQGDVAKWEGKGLQNPHHGFKSRRRLNRRQVATPASFIFESGLAPASWLFRYICSQRALLPNAR